MTKNKNMLINIQCEPVPKHIGVSKYTNKDWGTIAFIIPRNQIQSKFADQELRYNCIYFLFGFDCSEEAVYIGQAKRRNNGESVLARLREHDKSTTEKYSSIWEWAIVVTNKDNGWNLDDLNIIEYALYNTIPAKNRLNEHEPNHGDIKYESCIEKINQIKNYITIIGFDTFINESDTDKIQITPEIDDGKIVEDLRKGMARIPEIVTPHKVVQAMCDMLPEEVWNDKTVFLDPACKGGEYLREIYDRLMENELLQSKYPDEFERSNHILGEQLYGIALSQVSLERTTKKLKGYSYNIRVISDYISILKSIYSRREHNETQKIIKDVIDKEFGKEMKIDVVIGNPPYQESNGGGNGSGGVSIYDNFVLSAIDITSKSVCMITPMRWYTENKRLSTLREHLTKSNHLVQMHDFPNTDEVFGIGVYVMGGVCYYLYDKDYDGPCKIVKHRKQEQEVSNRYMLEDGCDLFIRDTIAAQIIKRIKSSDKVYMDEVISATMPFGIPTNEKGYFDRINETDLIMYVTGNNFRGGDISYIPEEYVTKGTEYIDTHKVYINAASDNMLSFPYTVLYKPFYGAPHTICNGSYLIIANVKNKEYCNNIISYLSTKFVRMLILQRKADQHIYAKTFSYVPIEDFTHPWTDQQLYEKHKLTKEEIEYIESTIKTMD